MTLLPTDLQPYGSIILLGFLAFDGFLLGIAAKKAVVSVILVVVALMLATFVGLSIPFLNSNQIITQVMNFVTTQVKSGGSSFFTLPVFWIIGFAVGLWKG